LLFSAFLGTTHNLRSAAKKTLLVFAPFVALAVIVFVIRWNVLHGLGGSADSANLLAVDMDRYSHTLGAFTRNLLWAFAGFASSTREIWPRLAAVLVICLLAGAVWLPRQHAALLLAGLVWLAGFAAFSILLNIETVGWLEYFALVGVALIIG